MSCSYSAYSIFFSKKEVTESLLEMTRLSVSSFFYCNPGATFTLFYLGCDDNDLKSLKDINPYLQLEDIKDIIDTGGWDHWRVLTHSLRYHPSVLEKIPPADVIGYFDLDIVHIRKWEVLGLEEGKIGAVLDVGLLSKNFVHHSVTSFFKKEGITLDSYYNSGVILWRGLRNTKDVLRVMSEVWEECVKAEYCGGNLPPWYDQHFFNKVLHRNRERVMTLSPKHNKQSAVGSPRGSSLGSGPFWEMLFDIIMSDGGNTQRVHIFSFYRRARLAALQISAYGHLPVSYIYPKSDISFVILQVGEGKNPSKASIKGIPVFCGKGPTLLENLRVCHGLYPRSHIVIEDTKDPILGVTEESLKEAMLKSDYASLCVFPPKNTLSWSGVHDVFTWDRRFSPYTLGGILCKEVPLSGLTLSLPVVEEILRIEGGVFLKSGYGIEGTEGVQLVLTASLLGYIGGTLPFPGNVEGHSLLDPESPQWSILENLIQEIRKTGVGDIHRSKGLDLAVIPKEASINEVHDTLKRRLSHLV